MSLSVEDLRSQLRNQIRAFARVAATETRDALMAAAPVDTGELRESITASVPVVTDARASFTVMTGDLIQAETTEKGARPHVIVPRVKQALAFDVGGMRVVVRKVNHPGNPPRPWFAPTVARWADLAARAWARVGG